MTESAYKAIFIPTRNEARGIFKHLKILSKTRVESTQIYIAESKQSKNKILLVLTGIGMSLAEKAIHTVLSLYTLQEIWLLGVCGATQIGFEAGDAFIADEILCEEISKPIFKTNVSLREKASHVFARLSQRVHSGKILTVGRIVEEASQKISFGKVYDCLALEMDAYPLAKKAEELKIPFLEIRWVLDPADYEVPPTQGFVDSQGEAKPFATFKTFALNPKLGFQMIPFVQKVQIALKNMNEFLHSYFEDGRI